MTRLAKGFCFVTLTCSLGASGWAADGPIRVRHIVPSRLDTNLTVSAVFENLFSDKIVATIQSGLPSIVQVELKLEEMGGRTVMRKRLGRRIAYDIWNEVYTVEDEDSSRTCRTLEEVKSLGNRLNQRALIALRKLDSRKTYRLEVRVGIVAISAQQSRKVSDWILNPNQTEEAVASQDRTAGFKFTLGNLVSFFMGEGKGSRYVSDWYTSPAFRLPDLP